MSWTALQNFLIPSANLFDSGGEEPLMETRGFWLEPRLEGVEAACGFRST